MRHVHSRKVILLVTFCSFLLSGYAQKNAYNFSQKFNNQLAHFGIAFGYNQAYFNVDLSEEFALNDTIRLAQSQRGPGFSLGVVGTFHLKSIVGWDWLKNFEARTIPGFSFYERQLHYDTYQDADDIRIIESINFEVPMLIKYKSEPYIDMRAYVLTGIKYSYDLASNAQARNADDLVKIKRHDFTWEYGLGFEFYFPMFIFTPEIRYSNGLNDAHSLDPSLQFSNVFDRLSTRGWVISIHFEG